MGSLQPPATRGKPPAETETHNRRRRRRVAFAHPHRGVPAALRHIVFTLSLVAVAGAAAAEPSSQPLPEPRSFKSLVPIEAAGGGLVGRRTR
jgi:hypothetical protein